MPNWCFFSQAKLKSGAPELLSASLYCVFASVRFHNLLLKVFIRGMGRRQQRRGPIESIWMDSGFEFKDRICFYAWVKTSSPQF